MKLIDRIRRSAAIVDSWSETKQEAAFHHARQSASYGERVRQNTLDSRGRNIAYRKTLI